MKCKTKIYLCHFYLKTSFGCIFKIEVFYISNVRIRICGKKIESGKLKRTLLIRIRHAHAAR